MRGVSQRKNFWHVPLELKNTEKRETGHRKNPIRNRYDTHTNQDRAHTQARIAIVYR